MKGRCRFRAAVPVPPHNKKQSSYDDATLDHPGAVDYRFGQGCSNRESISVLYRFSSMVRSPCVSVFELYDRFNYLRGYVWSGRRQKFEESVDRLLELLDRAEEVMPDCIGPSTRLLDIYAVSPG